MKVYTVKELSDLLKVKPSTVRSWVNQGKLKGVKLGKLWRIPEEEVQRILSARGE